MRSFLIVLIGVMLSSCTDKTTDDSTVPALSAPVQKPNKDQETNELRTIIIHYSGDSPKRITDEAAAYGAEVVYNMNNLKIVVLRIPAKKSIDQAIKHFEQVPTVIAVTRDQINQLQNR